MTAACCLCGNTNPADFGFQLDGVGICWDSEACQERLLARQAEYLRGGI